MASGDWLSADFNKNKTKWDDVVFFQYVILQNLFSVIVQVQVLGYYSLHLQFVYSLNTIFSKIEYRRVSY